MDLAALHGGKQGTARFGAVPTVAEAAATQIVAELDEAIGDLVRIEVGQAEFADSRGIDQLPAAVVLAECTVRGCAAREAVEPRRGRGVGSLAAVLGQAPMRSSSSGSRRR